jgi:hypothetical protein
VTSACLLYTLVAFWHHARSGWWARACRLGLRRWGACLWCRHQRRLPRRPAPVRPACCSLQHAAPRRQLAPLLDSTLHPPSMRSHLALAAASCTSQRAAQARYTAIPAAIPVGRPIGAPTGTSSMHQQPPRTKRPTNPYLPS